MSESDAVFAPWGDQDIPNFDLGLDLDKLNDDGPDLVDLNEIDQDGGALTYTVEDVKQRKIAKFNVQGFEYKVRIQSMDRNMQFDHAVQAIHSIIEGKIYADNTTIMM